mmetsp:Transcript_62914/g.136626  ORF Transcript_62914/g.136626 Transcript_62914/m.136626 type:complete len:165 (+) Transcript_62914:88-582(+)
MASNMALLLCMSVVASAAAILHSAGWKPEPCEAGKPCHQLYEHSYGSEFIGACPIESVTVAEGCAAYFEGKEEAAKCPQLTCPKALGKTFKLTCSGGCCPTCWAPDHVVGLDRHTAIDGGLVVETAPAAPPSCAGARCFEPTCAEGFAKGYVQGQCCYSCVASR